MIPDFNIHGFLPPGIHWANWSEFIERYGKTPYRQKLVIGLKMALNSLKAAGCPVAYIDGSFVTIKEFPNDYDACWETKGVDPNRLDPVFLEFGNGRASQKVKYLGEFFPAEILEMQAGTTFLEFFQIDKDTGKQKGIIAIDLERLL